MFVHNYWTIYCCECVIVCVVSLLLRVCACVPITIVFFIFSRCVPFFAHLLCYLYCCCYYWYCLLHERALCCICACAWQQQTTTATDNIDTLSCVLDSMCFTFDYLISTQTYVRRSQQITIIMIYWLTFSTYAHSRVVTLDRPSMKYCHNLSEAAIQWRALNHSRDGDGDHDIVDVICAAVIVDMFIGHFKDETQKKETIQSFIMNICRSIISMVMCDACRCQISTLNHLRLRNQTERFIASFSSINGVMCDGKLAKNTLNNAHKSLQSRVGKKRQRKEEKAEERERGRGAKKQQQIIKANLRWSNLRLISYNYRIYSAHQKRHTKDDSAATTIDARARLAHQPPTECVCGSAFMLSDATSITPLCRQPQQRPTTTRKNWIPNFEAKHKSDWNSHKSNEVTKEDGNKTKQKNIFKSIIISSQNCTRLLCNQIRHRLSPFLWTCQNSKVNLVHRLIATYRATHSHGRDRKAERKRQRKKKLKVVRMFTCQRQKIAWELEHQHQRRWLR